MINGVILQFLASFIVRQFQKYGERLDWNLIKLDFAKRIRALVPGTDYDDTAVFMVNVLIDLVVELFKQHGKIEEAKISEFVTSANKAMSYEITKRAMNVA